MGGLRAAFAGPIRIAFLLLGTGILALAFLGLNSATTSGAPPIVRQYHFILRGLVGGDLGLSVAFARPLSEALVTGLIMTLELALPAGVLACALGVMLGRLAAASDGGWIDRLIRFYMALGRSTPAFWLAIILALAIGAETWLLPSAVGIGTPAIHMPGLLLPIASIVFVATPAAVELMRKGLLQEQFADHISAARSRGLPERWIQRRHVARNSLLPATGRLAAGIGPLLGLTVAIEKVYALPGLGRLLVDSIIVHDLPAAELSAWFFAVLLILLRLPALALARIMDPRVADGRSGKGVA